MADTEAHQLIPACVQKNGKPLHATKSLWIAPEILQPERYKAFAEAIYKVQHVACVCLVDAEGKDRLLILSKKKMNITVSTMKGAILRFLQGVQLLGSQADIESIQQLLPIGDLQGLSWPDNPQVLAGEYCKPRRKRPAAAPAAAVAIAAAAASDSSSSSVERLRQRTAGGSIKLHKKRRVVADSSDEEADARYADETPAQPVEAAAAARPLPAEAALAQLKFAAAAVAAVQAVQPVEAAAAARTLPPAPALAQLKGAAVAAARAAPPLQPVEAAAAAAARTLPPAPALAQLEGAAVAAVRTAPPLQPVEATAAARTLPPAPALAQLKGAAVAQSTRPDWGCACATPA
jgi:hypothetical protein